MIYDGKLFEYPSFCRPLWHVGVVFGLSFFVASIYALLTKSFSAETFLWIFGIFFGMAMAGGSLVEMHNYHPILVNDERISLLRPNRRLDIPWSDIDRAFYSRSEGVQAKHPFFSFYIKAKNGDIIKISQYIENFHELGSIVLERCPSGKAEYIPFADLARLYYRSYWKKPFT